MTPIEMVVECIESISHGGVMLTLPRGKMPKGFPRGEVLNEMERDGVVEVTRRFNPTKVLAWLVRNGIVRMVKTDGKTLRLEQS